MQTISQKSLLMYSLLVSSTLTLSFSNFKPAELEAIKQFTYAANAISTPSSLNEIKSLMNKAIKEKRTISLVGANRSMGGQTASNNTSGYRISLEKYNKLIAFDVQNQEVTVQAGMTWRDLQVLIAPHGLAIRAMQSYHDFAIGGSLSVNVHGQDIHDAPLIKTVKSFHILLADGRLLNVSRTENPELFGLAVGGYGLFGIILDVTLNLTTDTILDQHCLTIDADMLSDHFIQDILPNDNISFYSTRFSMGNDDLLDKALIIYYTDSKEKPAEKFKSFAFHQGLLARAFLALTKLSASIKDWRFFFEKQYLNSPKKISRNNFLNISTSSLPQFSKYILQEYFIPYDQLDTFLKKMKTTFKQHKVNIINVSARHVPADTESMLNYAPVDCCALVLYINIPESNKGYVACSHWTNELINAALKCRGTYYLPYHLLGTDTQILQAYPNLPEFLTLKKQYDPQELFSNRLYERYKHLAN